jgi:hypothetical protein
MPSRTQGTGRTGSTTEGAGPVKRLAARSKESFLIWLAARRKEALANGDVKYDARSAYLGWRSVYEKEIRGVGGEAAESESGVNSQSTEEEAIRKGYKEWIETPRSPSARGNYHDASHESKPRPSAAQRTREELFSWLDERRQRIDQDSSARHSAVAERNRRQEEERRQHEQSVREAWEKGVRESARKEPENRSPSPGPTPTQGVVSGPDRIDRLRKPQVKVALPVVDGIKEPSDSSTAATEREIHVFIGPVERTPGGIAYFFEYHPYHGGHNPLFDDISRKVLDLKRNAPAAIQHFLRRLDRSLGKGIPIVIVPSHDPEKTTSGIRTLAQQLANNGRIDATSCLVRTQHVDSQAQNGRRSEEVHRLSLRVGSPQKIKGKTVLVLDDVTTTGLSLIIAKELLINAGARRVECAALAKTVSRH